MFLLNSKNIFWLIYIHSGVMGMDALLKDLLTPNPHVGESCGFESCPKLKAGWINVHLVPHSHGELGLAKTFTEYYTGDSYGGAMRMRMNWKNILDSTISELWADKQRTFTISSSELPYFFYWWQNREGTIHRMVYELVRQGRLVFVGGAWGMPDEASTSYQAIIDSYTYALRKLNATFLSCARPLVAWQADSFGHSREHTSLVAQMGFAGLYVNPISFDDELLRMERRALEFVWRGSDDLGAVTDIYTHKLFDGYWSPPGYCFGSTCDDPLLFTSSSVFNNVDERVKWIDDFITKIRYRQAPHYNTGHVIMMMGQRLGYYDAKLWFANIDKLINNLNEKTYKNKENIHATYSTPACYLKAVYEENPLLETKQDDFFPYAYNKDTYVTGMYTTRPSFKYLVRESNIFLQMAKQLQVLTNLDNNDKLFENFNWIMGVAQDHNIISGAMRDHVASYYTQKLHSAVQWSTELIEKAFNKIRKSPPNTEYYLCYLNTSSCPNTKLDKFHITIYNPLAWPVTMPVRLPIRNIKYEVFDPTGATIKAIRINIPEHVFDIPNRIVPATYELVFIAENIPPLGLRSYFIEKQKKVRIKKPLMKKIKNQHKKFKRQALNENETHIEKDYNDFGDIKLDDKEFGIDKLDDPNNYGIKTPKFRSDFDETQIAINDKQQSFDDLKLVAEDNIDDYDTVTMKFVNAFDETQFTNNDEWPVKNADDLKPTVSINNYDTVTLRSRNDFDETFANKELAIPKLDDLITTNTYETITLKNDNDYDDTHIVTNLQSFRRRFDDLKATTEYDANAYKNYDEQENLAYNNSETNWETETTNKGANIKSDNDFVNKDPNNITDDEPTTKTYDETEFDVVDVNNDTSRRKIEVTSDTLSVVTRTENINVANNDIEMTSEQNTVTSEDRLSVVTRTENINLTNNIEVTSVQNTVNFTSKHNIEVTSDSLNVVTRTENIQVVNINDIETTTKQLKVTYDDKLNAVTRTENVNLTKLEPSKPKIEVKSVDLSIIDRIRNESSSYASIVPVEEIPFDISELNITKLKSESSRNKVQKVTVIEEDIDFDDDYYAKEVNDKFIRNQYIQINLDEYNKISSMNLSNGVNTSLDIQYYHYPSDEPIANSSKRRPGACIFRSATVNPEAIIDFIETKVYKSDIVEEIHTKYSKYASFAVKLYKNSPVIEVDWIIGPIPVDDNVGKEVFVRYTTDLENGGVFYTDANGRQMVKRIRHTRPLYEPYNLDPIAGNFYPVTSRIYIEDKRKNLRFSILNDRSQGGSSLLEGSVDMMVHRRILTDDTGSFIYVNEIEENKGVIVRGSHYLYLTKADHRQNRVYEKKLAKEIELKPQIMFNKIKQNINKNNWNKYKNEFSFINKKLPIGIHILTIQEWDKQILLRLENYLEKVDVVRNGVKKVNLKDIFVNIKVLNVIEMNLSANMLLKDINKLSWRLNGSFVRNFNDFYGSKDKLEYSDDFKLNGEVDIEGLILAPQQIRTFVIDYEYVGINKIKTN